MADGSLVMVNSDDGRFTAGSRRLPGWFVQALRKEGQVVKQPRVASRWPDAVNNSELQGNRTKS